MGVGLHALARRFAGAFLAIAIFALCGLPAQAQRLALVVGNAQYDVASDLKNPATDATAIADALTRLGFKVTLLTDVKGPDFWENLDAFIVAAETAESTVFYYSGHAFQMSGVNYLVPVSAKLESRDSIAAETWSLDAIIARLQSRTRQTLIFLDACRNDPLPASVRGAGAASDGLARVQTGVGTFVAFATEPGGVTADGVGEAPNSPFTTALLKHIETAGISISDMMIEVRNDVETATLRKQAPWDQSSLREQFYFVPPEETGKQELSEADFELLAQLSPEDRKVFMDLLADSGFDEESLQQAEAQISVSEANLETVANETIMISAAVEEPAPNPDVGIDTLEIVPGTIEIGIAPTTPDEPTEPQDPDQPIRLAALNWDTRDIAINEVTIERLRLEGRVLNSDNEADRALITAIDPALLDGDIAPDVNPEDLAMSVQTELRRVGCYQMRVDGDWGKGSRTALTSYFLAKKVVPNSLEPTAELYANLKADTNVVCKVRVAKSAVSTGNRTAKAEPVKIKAKGGVTTGKNGNRPPETAKKKIIKSGIGMTGSF